MNNFITVASQFRLRAYKKKKKVNTLSFIIFFLFILMNFLLFLNPRVDEILFIYLFIILLCIDTF